MANEDHHWALECVQTTDEDGQGRDTVVFFPLWGWNAGLMMLGKQESTLTAQVPFPSLSSFLVALGIEPKALHM